MNGTLTPQIPDPHKPAYAFYMPDGHNIKPAGALPLVDVGNSALRDIKDIPPFFSGPPTILDIFIEVEKALIQFAYIGKSLPSYDMTGAHHPVY